MSAPEASPSAMHLAGVRAASDAFLSACTALREDAPIHSVAWPTVGDMIDHLGNIQCWATEVLRTGDPIGRREFARPDGADRRAWFAEVSAGLTEVLEETAADRPCWTLFDAPRLSGFWARRMMAEATKHLWDVRTATDPNPVMPSELSLDAQADVLDEFVAVFVAAARARGIPALPRNLVLSATDIEREWFFQTDWQVTTDAAPAVDAEVLRARVGDLVLFVWERATPAAHPERFTSTTDEAVRAFAETPIHL
ncbi:maleylpyruvate isomerase N-terminal domain-containing protein [Microbacterium koreense]|uniref:Maleylpyruvate isomerase N-terminal domain-containing protein n=1 Tax=Microbacterium koreense TaxID=323761 RepID=A0ABW2ZSW6_9MICO